MVALEFTDTITLGAVIIAAVGGIAVIFGTIYGTKYKVGYEAASAAAEELRASLADERDRVQRLEAALAASRQQLSAAQEQIARLESLPDLAHIVGLLDRHETRAQERHEATTAVLQALTDRITAQQPQGGSS